MDTGKTATDKFETNHTDPTTGARCGRMHLAHGPVETPAFMPVGTVGTVKAIRHSELERMGFRLILSNAYHLFLRPGVRVIEELGGLHAFTSWPHNILTDSGGYQLFSLAPFRKFDEEGVSFQSHIDGSRHRFTPEEVVDVQTALGSDIQMPLDVCTPYGSSREEAEEATRVTTIWARRAYARWRHASDHYRGMLFGIIQGNFFRDLRTQSAAELLEIPFPGYAIGGLSVGEPRELFNDYLSLTSSLLPEDRPRYVMGIGTPDYILDAIANGIDMFDCVFPTRAGRNGTVLTRHGRLALRNARFATDGAPIEEQCHCEACRRYSRAYLRHLFKAEEMLGPVLATEHNLCFLKRLIDEIRQSIRKGTFATFREQFMADYRA